MNRITKMLTTLGAVAALSTSAFAGYTTINTGNNTNPGNAPQYGVTGGGAGNSLDGSDTLLNVLSQTYGGGANALGGSSITGTISYADGVSLTRVQDTGGTTPEYLDGSTYGGGSGASAANDSVWHDGTVLMNVKAIVAGDSQSFGYTLTNAAGVIDGAATTLIANPVAGSTVTTSTLVGTSAFVFFDKPSDGDSLYSTSSNNVDGSGGTAIQSEDHEVTFSVSGLAGQTGPVWLLAWEDEAANQSSDFDYNDLVVQISAQAVPVPASVWMGLVTLAGMGMVVGLRRRQMA